MMVKLVALGICSGFWTCIAKKFYAFLIFCPPLNLRMIGCCYKSCPVIVYAINTVGEI